MYKVNSIFYTFIVAQISKVKYNRRIRTIETAKIVRPACLLTEKQIDVTRLFKASVQMILIHEIRPFKRTKISRLKIEFDGVCSSICIECT